MLILQKENIIEEGNEKLLSWLFTIQNNLFDLGSKLATVEDSSIAKPFPYERIENLEKIIDEIQPQLKPLTSFVLPGGDVLNGGLHICRTVCRRIERLVVALGEDIKLDSHLLIYLNRLSDVLFAMARWVMVLKDKEEILWRPGL